MMKNVQQMRTMFPMGLSDESSVCTTSLSPGALLMTLSGLRALTRRKTRRMPKILAEVPRTTMKKVSTRETMTKDPSMMFQPDLK